MKTVITLVTRFATTSKNPPAAVPIYPRLRPTPGLKVLVSLTRGGTLTANAQTKSGRHSAPPTQAVPQSAGVSVERLARIDAICEQAIQEDRIPGVVALGRPSGKRSFITRLLGWRTIRPIGR